MESPRGKILQLALVGQYLDSAPDDDELLEELLDDELLELELEDEDEVRPELELLDELLELELLDELEEELLDEDGTSPPPQPVNIKAPKTQNMRA